MSIGNRQLGWSQEATNTWYVAKAVERLSEVVASTGGGGGGGADKEFVVTTYRAKNAFTGASVGDTITATQVYDVSGVTPVLLTTIWYNQSTSAAISAPAASNLEIVGSQALTDAQLRATPVSVVFSNATSSTLVSGQSPVGSAPALNPVSVSGIDAGGLKRHIRTDTDGKIEVNAVQSLPLPAGAATEATLSALNTKIPALVGGKQPVLPENITNKFREAFEVYDSARWTQQLASGDIIALDGNTAAASYLVISKNPLGVGESRISTVSVWGMPFEAAVGLSLSQRTLGQEFSYEVISDEAALPTPTDIAITSIFQSTTTLTVNTTSAHNLRIGMRIGIRNVLDSRVNYPALVVATIPTTNQFTATAGPGGTIPSLTSYLGNALAATTAALPAAVYANGTAGVGATLTASANGAFPAQDGVSIPLNGRVLVKNQTTQLENGLYVLTQVGTVGTPWILTRATDFDTAAEMTVVAGVPLGIAIHVEQGTTQALRKYYLTATVTTVGTTAVVFADAGVTSALGSVFYRQAMGLAPNGVSQLFENATATNSSFYVRSEAGDVLPSSTIAGNHSITIGTTASVQAVNAALSYAFQPTNEFRLTQFIDGFQWTDVAVDSIAATNNRYKRTQVVPDPTVNYRFRIRATNNPSLTVPNAQIVSAVKTGTTTATVTTDVAHNLVIGDLVVLYGARDTTNFANLATATAVASIVNSTTFTIVWGAAVTATTYGGYVAKVQGGNLMSALGAITQVIQSASRTSNIVSVVGSAAWSGFLIGDYINIIGVRDASTGATLGIDGAYRVRDIQTTTAFLEPIGTTPTGADIVSTNCGGSIIKRTDMRISYVRIMDFARQRVELLDRPAGDISKSAPVAVTNQPTVNAAQSGTWNIGSITTLPALPAGTNLIGSLINLQQIGGITANSIVPSFERMTADNLRRNINVS